MTKSARRWAAAKEDPEKMAVVSATSKRTYRRWRSKKIATSKAYYDKISADPAKRMRRNALAKARITRTPEKHAKHRKMVAERRVRRYQENPEQGRLESRLNQKRRRLARPPWVNRQELLQLEKARDALTALNGAPWNVDHIIPIKGMTDEGHEVCGLDVLWNCELIQEHLNIAKQNQVPMDRILSTMDVA